MGNRKYDIAFRNVPHQYGDGIIVFLKNLRRWFLCTVNNLRKIKKTAPVLILRVHVMEIAVLVLLTTGKEMNYQVASFLQKLRKLITALWNSLLSLNLNLLTDFYQLDKNLFIS